jgi:hypothetical protein
MDKGCTSQKQSRGLLARCSFASDLPHSVFGITQLGSSETRNEFLRNKFSLNLKFY